jgi:hypothetical protein
MNTQTQVQDKITSVYTTQIIRFIKGENTLSYSFGDEMRIISRDLPYFDLLVDAIDNNPELLTENQEKLIFQSTQNGTIDQAGRFWYNGKLFPVGSACLVKRAEESGLSLEPVLAFLEKAEQSPEYAKLVKLVSDKVIEITWDGNVILYTRAAWGMKKIDATTWIDEETVKPGQVESFKVPARTGTFEYITRQCPDQGVIFEAMVNPANVTSVNDFLYVTEYTILGRLEEKAQPDNYGISLVYRATQDAGPMLVRSPYNIDTARAYLSACVKGTTVSSLEGVSISGSC